MNNRDFCKIIPLTDGNVVLITKEHNGVEDQLMQRTVLENGDSLEALITFVSRESRDEAFNKMDYSDAQQFYNYVVQEYEFKMSKENN